MTHPRERGVGAGFAFFIALALSVSGGCASIPSGPAQYSYFGLPEEDDAWSPKITAWQRRDRHDSESASGSPGAVLEAADQQDFLPSSVAVRPDLRDGYMAFKSEQKRVLARSVAAWVQARALDHYVADGPVDHWATLEETLNRNGDDCDGLELLTFHALRDLGFRASEVYRAIVYRTSDGQHHMVTLWFEEKGDPWVIDPTGVMALGMPRMSDLADWVPIKLFSDSREFTVRPGVEGKRYMILADNLPADPRPPALLP